MQTNLRIFRNGVEIPLPRGSARFIDFSSEPIRESVQTARTIDGRLLDLSDDAFRVMEVRISSRGVKVPALTGTYPGQFLTIHSPEKMTEPGPAVTLSREPVPGSIRAFAANGDVIAEPEGRSLSVPGAAWFEYRPILSVMVTGFATGGTEGKAVASWQLTAEESDGADAVAPPPTPVNTFDPDDWAVATGGIVSEYTDADGKTWREHDILSSQSVSVSSAGDIELDLLGGGGGGGNLLGGGGGAGGYLRARVRVSAGSHAVLIGAGGLAGQRGSNSSDVSRHGRRGTATQAFGLEAPGGGGGHGYASGAGPYIDGASGGGQANHPSAASSGAGAGTAYLGNSGGASNAQQPGGGGGAQSAGENASTNLAGRGGAGVDVIKAGSPLRVCVGGSGGVSENSGAGTSPGATEGGSDTEQPGAINSGNGGGAGFLTSDPASGDGANGGSGRVIIRYRIG